MFTFILALGLCGAIVAVTYYIAAGGRHFLSNADEAAIKTAQPKGGIIFLGVLLTALAIIGVWASSAVFDSVVIPGWYEIRSKTEMTGCNIFIICAAALAVICNLISLIKGKVALEKIWAQPIIAISSALYGYSTIKYMAFPLAFSKAILFAALGMGIWQFISAFTDRISKAKVKLIVNIAICAVIVIVPRLNFTSAFKTKPSSYFSNKYGTADTVCAISGCNKKIAVSGDTNCCVEHSKKCLECGCYIDSDALMCMQCVEEIANKK